MLRRLAVTGYKSLRDVSLSMRPLRILIGPNAAGKGMYGLITARDATEAERRVFQGHRRL